MHLSLAAIMDTKQVDMSHLWQCYPDQWGVSKIVATVRLIANSNSACPESQMNVFVLLQSVATEVLPDVDIDKIMDEVAIGKL